jgi:rhodanese-related sulfurtransferase
MSLLAFFKKSDINEGVKEFRADKNSVLLDVRSKGEYAAGHIPGSINIPLDRIDEAARQIPDKKTAVFVYCLRGARSRRAVRALSKMGYEAARSIGGINSYTGQTER